MMEDCFSDTETISFSSREEFNAACNQYANNPRLIDIGYADMIIILQKE